MRPTRDQYFMALAELASTRATCLKRAVGCALVDKRGHILAIGYNGVAAGMPHCNEGSPCRDWDLPTGLDQCEAVHAETNALLQCRDPWSIETAYVTLSPCKPCIKLLMNTSCRKIVVKVEHSDLWAKEQWLKQGRLWEVLI